MFRLLLALVVQLHQQGPADGDTCLAQTYGEPERIVVKIDTVL